MQGVTTAIVAFIFVCLVYPHLVKSRPQFYMSLVLVLVVILFDAIGHMSTGEGTALFHVMYVLSALVQMFAMILLVLCVGGLSVSDLAGEMANAVEVIRRGEDKPVLVPLKGEQPKAREEGAGLPPRRTSVKPAGDSPIPLE